MTNTNVIDLKAELLRRERPAGHAAYSRPSPSRGRHREGIDGLWTEQHVARPTGEVVQLVTARRHQPT